MPGSNSRGSSPSQDVKLLPTLEENVEARRCEPWDTNIHILATVEFPSTSILRQPKSKNVKGAGTCSCTGDEVHRSLFDLNRTIVGPCLRSDKPIPPVKVCWNAENIWECKLPVSMTGLKRPVEFSSLETMENVYKVLWKGTYWFRRLLAPDRRAPCKWGRNGLAVLRLLAGLPGYSGKERVDQLLKLPLNKGAVNKLRNILAVVDGLLMQLVLCFPDKEEFQSWKRIDQVVHCLMCQLLPDYFRDDSPGDYSRLTTFEKVKKLRKAIKEQGFNPIGDLGLIDIPREISFMKVIVSFIKNGKTPLDMYRVATLCQTRASGVPPRAVYLKTLEKIKMVLIEPPDPSNYNRVKTYIRVGIDGLHQSVLNLLGSESSRENFWRLCLDKAKISLSDSGEFFTNSQSGGKLEAARLVLSENSEVMEVDLHTGNFTGVSLNRENSNVGERLFHWACGQFRDRDNCYERNLMSVRISLVAELGKYRGITVSHLAHAILLHVLSHICLEYLKVIPSSESGVGAANHAWNFFKRLSHKNPHANFLFGDKEVYLFSTDWEQATDYCDHTIAQAMLNRLCYNLGIPNWYRQTSIFALCAPRQVEFLDPESKTLEMFYTTRGELMGDPVVKVILHLYHLVTRFAALQQLEIARLRGGKPSS